MSEVSNDDGWICGTSLDDPEHASFTDVFSTKEEAMEAGQEDVGWYDGNTFQVGKLVHSVESMPSPVDVDRLLDNAENGDWTGDVNEAWYEKVTPAMRAELQEKLDAVWETWCGKHKLTMTVMRIDHVESVPFTKKEGPADE